MSGPRTSPTSAFPGAPGVPGGVKSADAGTVASSVVGNNDYLEGGPVDTPVRTAFPGYTGANWQDYQPGDAMVGDEP